MKVEPKTFQERSLTLSDGLKNFLKRHHASEGLPQSQKHYIILEYGGGCPEGATAGALAPGSPQVGKRLRVACASDVRPEPNGSEWQGPRQRRKTNWERSKLQRSLHSDPTPRRTLQIGHARLGLVLLQKPLCTVSNALMYNTYDVYRTSNALMYTIYVECQTPL